MLRRGLEPRVNRFESTALRGVSADANLPTEGFPRR